MDESSDCSFPIRETYSKVESPNRFDDNLVSSDEITVINPEIEALTKTTRDSKNNILLSIPSKFPGELVPTINLNQGIMSIILRDCKVIKKSTAFSELIILEFFASNLPGDINLHKVKEALQKKTNLTETE